jgi:DNA polymerase-3 subunit beta
MICALRRVLIFSEKTSSLIKLEFGNDSVNISGQDYDFSTSAEEKLPCSYTDNPLSIGFKGTLLREILDNMDGQDILFQLNNPSRPGIIVPAEQNEKEQVLMLLMPMMLND